MDRCIFLPLSTSLPPPHHLPPSPFHPSFLPSPPHLPPLTTSLPLSRSDKKASSSQPEEKKAYLEPENVVLLPMVVGRLHDASRLPPRNEVNEWLATNCECVCVRERERERKCVNCVCVCASMCASSTPSVNLSLSLPSPYPLPPPLPRHTVLQPDQHTVRDYSRDVQTGYLSSHVRRITVSG